MVVLLARGRVATVGGVFRDNKLSSYMKAGVLYFALVVATLMLDIEMEWTPSRESLKSSGWSAFLPCRIPDR
jgi:hypothetical protein